MKTKDLYFTNPFKKIKFGKYKDETLADVFMVDREYVDNLISTGIIAVRGSAYLVMLNTNSNYARMLKKQVNDYL